MERIHGVRVRGQGGLDALHELLTAAEALDAAGFIVHVRVRLDVMAGPHARSGEAPLVLGEGLEVANQRWG